MEDQAFLSKAELAGLIDHTLLKPDATPRDIIELCSQAVSFGFKAVCVNPCYIPLVHRELTGSRVLICTVVGFPLGAGDPALKAVEAGAAVRAGALEVDVVMNIGFFKGGLLTQVQDDLAAVVQAARRENSQVAVKVILETCLLNNQEKIVACRLAVEAGADFVKTSTGFGKGGATIQDVALLRRAVGPSFGVKAAGGIRNLQAALNMIKAGANRLGTSSGASILLEHSHLIDIQPG
ncbi:Deoxyribose-phosphate aldolase [Pelotomaculum schinkii]|uniref:Deoxyribose-phosphate aldolase n=1 Tax=Pelotomaculum schinkii TaxID=78350 RepID=A0A4Y7RD23_9FIRM|nr:Deoxyribose-phosphate aldolase [Pelotomaculum schinkii]